MKKYLLIVLCVLLCFASITGLVACNVSPDSNPNTVGEDNLADKGNWTVNSPDGTIAAKLKLDAYGKLTYTVEKDGKTVVGTSSLGMEIEEDDFTVTTLHKESNRKVKGEYENISGKSAKVTYNANETTLTFKAWTFYIDVVMRAYDDGYAFRYNVRKIDGSSGVMTVIDENTTFAFPKEAMMWAQEYVAIAGSVNSFAYETDYQARMVESLDSSQYIAMPLLYSVPDSDYYSLVTESELVGSGFYGSFLKVQQDNDFSGVMQTVHTPAGAMLDDNKIGYPFQSPWRVGIVGDMATVVESELVEKVYDDVEYWKPDDYDQLSDEEKAIYTYDWVDSGVCGWSWLIYNGTRDQNDFALHREYLRLAKEMGWTYVLLDGGWNAGTTDDTLSRFVKEAEKVNVKVLVWCNALSDFGNGNVQILKAKLSRWASLGVAGIKIDFFDGQNATDPTHQGEDSDTIKWYESIYREAAKNRMVVNCHGSNKPTGERRQYPNVINREAVYGNEFKRVAASVTVNEMFVRNVIGPTDFTPVVNPLSDNITKAHQMALAVLFESGMPMMGDYPSVYKDNTVYSFYKSIPALKQKTVFLGGRPDFYYAAAAKTEDYWFVGIINSTVEDTVTIDFSFLEDGQYLAEIFTDVDETGKEVTKETIVVTNGDSKTFDVFAKGGVAIRLTKQG